MMSALIGDAVDVLAVTRQAGESLLMMRLGPEDAGSLNAGLEVSAEDRREGRQPGLSAANI